jgi:hypothetical protein
VKELKLILLKRLSFGKLLLEEIMELGNHFNKYKNDDILYI